MPCCGQDEERKKIEEVKRKIQEEQEKIDAEQRLWESQRSRAVCALQGVSRIRSLAETKAERAALAEVKKELRMSVVLPEGSLAVTDVEDQERVEAVLQLLRGLSPAGDPSLFTVELFKSVSKGGDEVELSDVLLKMERVVDVVQSSVILEVRAEDARLHQRLGPLAMKVWLSSCPADSKQEDMLEEHAACVKLIERDASALARLGGRGKASAEFCASLGIHPTLYTALMQKRGTFHRVEDGILVLSPQVTFAALFVGDVVDVLEQAPHLSMKARAYIASRALLAAAHLNVRGFSHGELRLANVGVTFEGEAVLFDFEALDKIGTPRSGISKYNLAPECVEQVCRGGWPHNTLEVDSWAAGVALYRIFTGANPFGEIPHFFDSLLDSQKALEVIKMEGVRSPAFELRAHGVPKMWEEIIVLLLQTDPATRPSLPQILEAYPEINNFAGV